MHAALRSPLPVWEQRIQLWDPTRPQVRAPRGHPRARTHTHTPTGTHRQTRAHTPTHTRTTHTHTHRHTHTHTHQRERRSHGTVPIAASEYATAVQMITSCGRMAPYADARTFSANKSGVSGNSAKCGQVAGLPSASASNAWRDITHRLMRSRRRALYLTQSSKLRCFPVA